jgi:hypothetical protein
MFDWWRSFLQRRRGGLPMMPRKMIYRAYSIRPERWDWVPILGYRRVRRRAAARVFPMQFPPPR